MKASHIVIGVVCLAAMAAGVWASACLAGQLYFLINKTLPPEFAFDTWYINWRIYHDHPVQRGRLLVAACAAPLLVFGVPLLAILGAASSRHSLYGDARWASAAEIRKAGLL